MTFEELKFTIIDRQRKKEIDKLFHLYVKAESYNDILKVIKSSGNFRWILNNGFRDLVQYFPTEELERENIYKKSVELSDLNSDIVMLPGSNLNLHQSGKNRCKIVVDSARVSVTVSDMAMVEIESYGTSYITVYNNGYGYTYITSRNESQITLHGNDTSSFYINALGTSIIQGYMKPKAYVYYKLDDNAKINFTKVEEIDPTLLLDIPFQNDFQNKVKNGVQMEIAGGSPSFGVGRKGYDFSAVFNGSKSIKTIGNLNIQSDKVTVSFWMKSDTNEYSVPIELSDYAVPNNAFVMLLNNNGDNIHWVDSDSGNLNSKLYTTIINIWFHVVLTIDRSLGTSQNNIYVNATSQGDNLYNSDLSGVFGIYQFFIGQRAGNTLGFKGQIQDFKFWNRILSSSEINNLSKS